MLAWLAAAEAARGYAADHGPARKSFEEIGDPWLAGVESGRIGRRRRRGKPYTDTTTADYGRT